MATKKTRPKKSASKGRASGGKKGKQNLLRTQFMADFTRGFIGDPKKIDDPAWSKWPDPPMGVAGAPRLWPASRQNQSDIVTDYATFVSVLMTVGYVGGSPPAAIPGSLGDKILQFLITEKWPSKTSVAQKWVHNPGKPAVHLIEIAVILDRLLQAAASFGSGQGGTPGGWPPH